MSAVTHVAVAVIVNDNDEVCISLRHKDAHQGGLWEFPGGKIEPGEAVEHALQREIKEELGLEILGSRPLIKISHDYGDKVVCLHVHKILSCKGSASGLEGQEVRWLPLDELSGYSFPEANRPIIKALSLPDKYCITGQFDDDRDFSERLTASLASGIRLVQLRLKRDSTGDMLQAQKIILAAADICAQYDARLMLNVPQSFLAGIDHNATAFTGFHLDSRSLKSYTAESLPASMRTGMLSASCHNRDELEHAIKLKADFVVLSPVQKTASHPELPAMGWQSFEQLIEDISIPVYALGGVSGHDLETAWHHGAQGVSAIRAFWK
jgi:8-oxo-dGTP diphosphatase